MKYFLPILIITCLWPIVAHADVHITEVAWMGTEQSQYSEWVEFYNDGDTSVDMAGWTLYKANTLLFIFTKTIGSGAYLLLERTTASAPDAVPDIDDESGTFGGGGLANTGEDLMLKDSTGNGIQSLDFASGWPVGDAKSKETMQWNGKKWVTAAPTPDEGLSQEADSKDAGTDETDDVVPIPAVSPNKPYVDFTVPDLIYSGIPYAFTLQPVLEYDYRIQAGNFESNMGDGTILYTTSIAPIAHTYAYPGTYVLSFSYSDPHNEHLPLKGTKEITVASPSIVVTQTDAKSFQIQNTSSEIIDLSGWNFVFPGRTVPVPDMTIVAAHATVTIPFQSLGIANQSSVSLVDPSGTLVASTVKNASPTTNPSSVHQASAPIRAALADEVSAASVAPIPQELTPPGTPTRNRTKTYIVGAVALFVIGLSILLERFMARQE